jgi:hypothetical protein
MPLLCIFLSNIISVNRAVKTKASQLVSYLVYQDNEYFGALVEVASSFLEILLNHMVDKTMVAAGVKRE